MKVGRVPWAATVLGLAALAYLMSVPRVSAPHLRSQAEANLPAGTPRKCVETWLAARRLRWGDIKDQGGRRVGLCGEIKKVYRVEFFSKTTIEFEFSFDEQDKLTSFSIDEDTNGL